MTDWAALHHAYGAAGDVPALLVAAEDTGVDEGPAVDEVWSRLCHQDTVYTASYAALPLLAGIAERHSRTGYIAALHLASAIVASKDGPNDAVALREQHSDTLRRLRDLAEEHLALAGGDIEFIYWLQALMAFEDGGVWQRNLYHLADGELALECPSCHEFLILNLDGPEITLRIFTDASVPPTPVQAGEPVDDLLGGRVIALCRIYGRSEVASSLSYLFGRAACPSCSVIFDIVNTLD